MHRVCLLLLLAACHPDETPSWCAERADDADCDGVPDAVDGCAGTVLGAFSDARGCSEAQVAGCVVSLASPDEGAKEASLFRWTGTCDVYLVQLSDDPAFPAGITRTAVRTTALAAEVTGSEKYWRVVGGKTGNSAGYATPSRALRW